MEIQLDKDMLLNLTSIFKDAKLRIEDINHWCQNDFALDAEGEHCSHTHERATRWDVLGSLWKSTQRFYPKGGPTTPFYDKRYDTFKNLETCAEAVVMNQAVLQFGSAYAAEANDDYPTSKIKELNDTSHVVRSKPVVHKQMLNLYDRCINYCEMEIQKLEKR